MQLFSSLYGTLPIFLGGVFNTLLVALVITALAALTEVVTHGRQELARARHGGIRLRGRVHGSSVRFGDPYVQ